MARTFVLHLAARGHAVEPTALHKALHICSHLLQQGCHRPAVSIEVRACIHQELSDACATVIVPCPKGLLSQQ